MPREPTTNTDWIDFQAVLEDPVSLSQFTLFAVREFSVENLLFHRRVKLLKKIANLSHSDIDDSNYNQILEREIMAIYREFIAENACNELNISENVRTVIENAIRSNQISIGIFDGAHNEVLMMVFQDTYPRYVQKL